VKYIENQQINNATCGVKYKLKLNSFREGGGGEEGAEGEFMNIDIQLTAYSVQYSDCPTG
jgi:hypothetical protein